MKSPLKVFFTLSVGCLLAGVFSITLWNWLSDEMLTIKNFGSKTNASFYLELADYHLATGNVEVAINEYIKIVEKGDAGAKAIAEYRLRQITSREQSFGGYTIYIAVRFLREMYPRLFGLGLLFMLAWIFTLFYNMLRKKNSFVLSPIKNYTDLTGCSELFALVLERMGDFEWQIQEASKKLDSVIAEQLEIPGMGLTNDNLSLNAGQAAETAWGFALGNSKISLEDALSVLRVWLSMPEYIINGSLLETDEDIIFRLLMYHSQNGGIHQSWEIRYPIEKKTFVISLLVDDVAFLLFSYFNNQTSTKNWRALQAFTKGVLFFNSFSINNQLEDLQSAQEFLRLALSLDPDYKRAEYNLGLVYMATGQFDLARDALQPLIIK